MAKSASEDLPLHHIDVIAAIQNGDLHKDIYMEQPGGCIESPRQEYVCRLEKALYGLKQAPRHLFVKINLFLCADLDFQTCSYDPSFYVKRTKIETFMITMFVDNLLVAGTRLQFVLDLRKESSSCFKVEDCGEAKICLGMEAPRN